MSTRKFRVGDVVEVRTTSAPVWIGLRFSVTSADYTRETVRGLRVLNPNDRRPHINGVRLGEEVRFTPARLVLVSRPGFGRWYREHFLC